MSSVDVSTKENLGNLVKVGEQLLENPVTRLNLDTGRYEPVENGGTNEAALKRWLHFPSVDLFKFFYKLRIHIP